MTKRFTLEVPDDFMTKFEKTIKGQYDNRSEAIRASMRLLIKEIEKNQHAKGLKRGES